MNPFAELGAHCRLCPKCGPVAREIFRTQDEAKRLGPPHPTSQDYDRVRELTGELCAQGERMWHDARATFIQVAVRQAEDRRRARN